MSEESPLKKPKSTFDKILPYAAIGLVFIVAIVANYVSGGTDRPRQTDRASSGSQSAASDRPAVIAPTPKKQTAGLRAELQSALDGRLGATGDIRQATLNAAGIYTIEWDLGDNITDSLAKRGAKNDIAAALQYIKEAGQDYKEVNLRGYTDLVDASGNVENRQVIYVTYTKETVDNINFDNFLADNVYIVADEVVNHPLFQD